jgi:hypothetical protein
MTKSITVEQFWKQNHRLNVTFVWSHPAQVKHYDCGIACDFDELPDHAIYRSVYVQQSGSSRSS